jgi:hypothetical protein
VAKEVLADESRGPVFVALDEPIVVVVMAEVLESLVQIFEVGEGVLNQPNDNAALMAWAIHRHCLFQ